MPTPRFDRLSDFHLADRNVLKAMFDRLLTDVEEQIDNVAGMLEDNTLTPGEKPPWILFHAYLTGEQSALSTQANTLGITTERTNYNNAVTALTTHLATLTSPVAWNDLSGNTTIVGTTFRSKFQDVLTTKQALLNKLDEVASAQSVVIDPFADVIIYATSTGTIKTGELPRNVPLTASKGNTVVTTSGTWSRTAVSGITCTIGASTGVLNITAMTSAEISVPVTFVYAGVTRTAKVKVVRQDDPPTSSSSGGGGSSGSVATTTTLGNTTGTSYDTTNAVSATLTATAGSAGKVQCSVPLTFRRVDTANDGSTGCFGKWQWRAIAGSWADITTEIQDTLPATTDTASDFPNQPGSLSCTMTKTGLTSGTDYEFRFVWRNRTVSGAASNLYYVSGTMTADGTVS